jgi:hypothetical protein
MDPWLFVRNCWQRSVMAWWRTMCDEEKATISRESAPSHRVRPDQYSAQQNKHILYQQTMIVARRCAGFGGEALRRVRRREALPGYLKAAALGFHRSGHGLESGRWEVFSQIEVGFLYAFFTWFFFMLVGRFKRVGTVNSARARRHTKRLIKRLYLGSEFSRKEEYESV